MSKQFYELNKVPNDWKLIKLKYVLSFSNDISDDYKNEKNLSLTKKGIIVKISSLMKGKWQVVTKNIYLKGTN